VARALDAADLPAHKATIDACGLFPSGLLDAMTAGFLAGATDELWLTAEAGEPAGLAYAAPERMTDGTWNLLLIAVRPERQGRGVGAALLAETERRLAAIGARLLLVETSALPGFEPARRFYRRAGFTEEARIRDYYEAGDDKIVFVKSLSRP
jgi:ribosomal protein S18 acetylase RimI-like enzyme